MKRNKAEYLKTSEVCEYLQVDRRTFEKHILPELPMYFIGQQPRYKKSEIDRYMEGTVRKELRI